MLRPSNPADLLALLMIQAGNKPGIAYGRQSLASGKRGHIHISRLVSEWLQSEDNCRTWMATTKGLTTGLVSVRKCGGQGSWGIGRLQVPSGILHLYAELIVETVRRTRLLPVGA